MGTLETDNKAPIIASLLREHIRREVKAELQKIAEPIIDAAVEKACAEFETNVMTEMEHIFQKQYVGYVVERRRLER